MKKRPWFKFYDPGVPQSIDYPDIPVHRFLEDAAKTHPDRPCTIFKGASITFAEMDALTDRLAAGLAELGVKKGQPVGIFMPNSPQFVMAFYAITKAGGVVVATNPQYKPREVEHQLNDAGVEVMLVMSNFYNVARQVRDTTPLKTMIVTNIKEYLPGLLRLLFTLAKEKKGGHKVELDEGDLWLKDVLARHTPEERPKVEVGPEDMALFQYSGGTTGRSKAAVALHRNLVVNTLQMRSWMTELELGEETVLMAIPMFHVYGLVAGMSFSISSSSTMVMVPDPRDIGDVLENIDKYKPTIYPGVPAMYNSINANPDVQAGKYDLRSIKACISGSAPLLRETKETFEGLTGGKLVEGFGMSEAPTATHANPLLGENRIGSI
ncbi:MAG: AMP-binding protein, partial [Anaerolineales bacterium]